MTGTGKADRNPEKKSKGKTGQKYDTYLLHLKNQDIYNPYVDAVFHASFGIIDQYVALYETQLNLQKDIERQEKKKANCKVSEQVSDSYKLIRSLSDKRTGLLNQDDQLKAASAAVDQAEDAYQDYLNQTGRKKKAATARELAYLKNIRSAKRSFTLSAKKNAEFETVEKELNRLDKETVKLMDEKLKLENISGEIDELRKQLAIVEDGKKEINERIKRIFPEEVKKALEEYKDNT